MAVSTSRKDRVSPLLLLPRDVASQVLLPYLSLREANCVRITCRELRAAVADAPWVDERTRVFQPKPFFAAFPHARAANLSGQRAVDHHGKQRGVMERAESLRVCDGDLALAMACHTLDLADQAGITDAGFASLRAVRKLTLGWRSPYDWRQWRVMQPELKLTDAGLRSIGSTLRELTLYRTTSISGAGFDCLGQLEALELHDASRVPPAAFGSLYSLTTLKLFGASFPDEPLRALSAAAPGKLRKLDLHLVHDRFPSDAALRTCTGLTSLSTNHASAAGLAHLSGILRELTIYEPTELHDILLAVGEKLEKLSFACSAHMNDTGPTAAQLSELKHLRNLEARRWKAGAEQVAAIADRIATLTLEGCDLLTDASIAPLAGSSTIRELVLGSNFITDAGLATALTGTQLHTISVNGCRNLTGSFLSSPALQNLQVLNVSHTAIDDMALKQLVGRRLRELRFAYSGVTLEGARSIDRQK